MCVILFNSPKEKSTGLKSVNRCPNLVAQEIAFVVLSSLEHQLVVSYFDC
jgi:hypothetical protein